MEFGIEMTTKTQPKNATHGSIRAWSALMRHTTQND